MKPEDIVMLLTVLQIVVSVVTLLGVVFLAGRFSARFDAVEKALFGGDDQRGIFMRRSEAEILIDKNASEHEEFRRRFDGLEIRRGQGV